MSFNVYDNNKPAKYPEHNVNASWNNNSFATFQEAVAYANHWLGLYRDSVVFELNVPYQYSGYSDEIVIRQED